MQWYTTDTGKNCPDKDIIRDKSSCTMASKWLGFNCTVCNKVNLAAPKYPAGCFYKVGSYHSHLNAIVSSDTAIPGIDTGGICAKKSMFKHKCFCYIHLPYLVARFVNYITTIPICIFQGLTFSHQIREKSARP